MPATPFRRWISLLWRALSTNHLSEGPIRLRLQDAISRPPHPLFTACIWGFRSHVLELVRCDPQLISARNQWGKSCLYLACENGYSDIVRTLLRNGVDVDQRLDYWGTSLQAAALSGDLGTLQQMLESGGFLYPPACCYGRTLDAAIRGANAVLVVWALDAGVEV